RQELHYLKQDIKFPLSHIQGFTVAVLYCFCNGEVRNCVRNHLERYRLRRTLRYGGDYPTPSSNNLYWRSNKYHNNSKHSDPRNNYAFKSLKTGQLTRGVNNHTKTNNYNNNHN